MYKYVNRYNLLGVYCNCSKTNCEGVADFKLLQIICSFRWIIFYLRLPKLVLSHSNNDYDMLLSHFDRDVFITFPDISSLQSDIWPSFLAITKLCVSDTCHPSTLHMILNKDDTLHFHLKSQETFCSKNEGM